MMVLFTDIVNEDYTIFENEKFVLGVGQAQTTGI